MTRLAVCVLVLFLQACTQVVAAPQERWILLGDSIQAKVFGTQSTPSRAKDLTAHIIPQLVNVHIQNISAGGMTMANSGNNLNAETNLGAIRMIDGAGGAQGIIITLGQNDWNNANITPAMFYESYKNLGTFAKSRGLEVICISPIWSFDQMTFKWSGGQQYQLWNYRVEVQNACAAFGGRFIGGTTAPLLPEHFADGVHMNAAGHAVFAPWLVQQMQSMGFWTDTYQ